MKTLNKKSTTNAVRQRFLSQFCEVRCSRESRTFCFYGHSQLIPKNAAIQILHFLHPYFSGFCPIYTAPRFSTKFYKCQSDTIIFYSILHFLHKLLYCRIRETLIFSDLTRRETCRTCFRWIYMFFRETFFFWALPFRSGYAGVSVLDDLPRCRLPLVICNVTVHLTQLRSLTIPNATKRRQSLSSGHLSADRDCPAERYNCTRHHGCTMFHCEVWSAVMAGGLSLLIGLSAARQTIIRYNCYILSALDFPDSRYLQSLAFPSFMRLFSHCKGKTRPLRTAMLCKVMPSGFG